MLPRVEIEVLPPEVQREGLDAFERIGEETSEVIEHRPASLVVVVIVRPKFVRKRAAQANASMDPDVSPVLIAEPPERPIDRGLAGPGLLAKTVVYRWQEHLPVYRQEKIHARDGLELARSIDFAIALEIDKRLNHLPLDRQRRQMARDGLEISTQTMWDQEDALAELLEPSYLKLLAYVLGADVIGADETHWRLMQLGSSKKWSMR